MARLKLGILVSGRGSNLQSLIDACRLDDFPAEIALVISNKPDAYALERASKAGITTSVIEHKNYPERESFDAALHAELQKNQIELVCLAGFMRILSEDFVNSWQGRMINIHPSLLPKFKGLHTHERAIEAGESESGCTVHFVTPGLDEGPIILQRKVPVEKGDTPETLAKRVLAEEHIAYPEAIRQIAPDILK